MSSKVDTISDGVRPVVYHSYGARLLATQKATHRWIRRREHHLIFAAVNLKREQLIIGRSRSTYCKPTIEATDGHEATRAASLQQ